MLISLLLAAVGIACLFLVAVALQPAEFRVTRKAILSAPASIVFAHVNDFHRWEAWSPWAKLDPNARNSFEGSSSGVGAVFRWAGNSKVGEGNMTITDSRPDSSIEIRLVFIKPFPGVNHTEFTFVPVGAQTEVT